MRYNSGTMEVNMNYNNKKDNNWIYRVIIALLVVILVFVSFCMLNIHVPYFNHENNIALERSLLNISLTMMIISMNITALRPTISFVLKIRRKR